MLPQGEILKQTCFVSSIHSHISHAHQSNKNYCSTAHRILGSNLLGLLCLSLPSCTSVFFAQATKKSAFRLFTLNILDFPVMLVCGLANHWVDSQLASGACILSLWSPYMCQLCSLQRTLLSPPLSGWYSLMPYASDFICYAAIVPAGATEQCLSICGGRFHEVTVNGLFFKITFEYFLPFFHSCPSCDISLHNLGFQLGQLHQLHPLLVGHGVASWLESNRGKEVISLDGLLCRQPMHSGLQRWWLNTTATITYGF